MLLKSHNNLSFCGDNYISIQWTSSKVSKRKDEWCTNNLSKFQDKSFHNQSFIYEKTLSWKHCTCIMILCSKAKSLCAPRHLHVCAFDCNSSDATFTIGSFCEEFIWVWFLVWQPAWWEFCLLGVDWSFARYLAVSATLCILEYSLVAYRTTRGAK